MDARPSTRETEVEDDDRSRARRRRIRIVDGAARAGEGDRVVMSATEIMEKIAVIELEISRTQKNKATATHLGSLRSKIAKLQRELIESSASKGGPKGEGFDVTKTGDCRVGLVGFPSVGKSTLLTKLTGVFSEAAAYEFTTLTCVPGVVRVFDDFERSERETDGDVFLSVVD